MNKIKIENNDMTLTVRMSDKDAEVWFGTLSRALLGDYPDIAEVIEPDAPRPAEENTRAQAEDPPDPEPLQTASHNRGGGKNWKRRA